MKKKLIFGGLVLLALVLTTGMFAYGYTNNSTGSINNVSYVDGAYNTVSVNGTPPNWNSVLPIIYLAPQYLHPNAAGDLTNLTPSTGTTNWQLVDEVTPDDSGTYVYTSSKWATTDLYALQDVTPSTNEIQGIKVYFRVQGNGTTGTAVPVISDGGTIYNGDTYTAPSGSWTTYSYEWTVDPSTGSAWTETAINALQAGITLTKPSGGGDVECTQVYVEVEYQLTITSGVVPSGQLYSVTPASGFTGDLTVSLYLVNTNALQKAYKYLNMEAYLSNSVEAGDTPSYRVISLANGTATFTIQGGAAAQYNLSIVGGGYAVISDNVSNWAAGWTVTPEFYCEVSQR